MKEIELSSGIKLTCVRVSPLLVMDLFRKYPEPNPPKVTVKIDGREVVEEVEADPDHQTALLQHRIEMERKLRNLYIRFGVKYELTDEDKAKVKELREYWQEENGAQLQGNDLFLFVSYIAIQTNEDYALITDEVGAQTQATPKSSADGDKEVPSDLQG